MSAVAAEPARTSAVFHVPLDQLHGNRANPRRDLGDLADLIESIQEHGVLQPLLAMRRAAGGLTVIAGNRRLAACRQAGLLTAPVLVVGDKLDDDRLILALAENLHRADLSPMDEAGACQALIDFGRSRADVAVELSRSGNWVADRLALLALPVELQRDVDAGRIPIGKAAQLGHQIRKRGSGSVTVGARCTYHFNRSHPLAASAGQRCDAADHPTVGRFGPACGACWETEIRSDAHGDDSPSPPPALKRTKRQQVDEVAVHRAVGGDRSVNLNTAERAAAIDRLNALDYSAAEIADRLGTSTRTVVRHRGATA